MSCDCTKSGACKCDRVEAFNVSVYDQLKSRFGLSYAEAFMETLSDFNRYNPLLNKILSEMSSNGIVNMPTGGGSGEGGGVNKVPSPGGGKKPKDIGPKGGTEPTEPGGFDPEPGGGAGCDIEILRRNCQSSCESRGQRMSAWFGDAHTCTTLSCICEDIEIEPSNFEVVSV